MPPNIATLYLLCGKPAAGKSTLAMKLAQENRAVLISEDTWLSALYSDALIDLPDYVRCSRKLRAIMGPHVADLLNNGMSVVLDFPANTVKTRNWIRGILDSTGARHALHLLDPPDAECIARLHSRNEKSDHPFAVTEQQFHRIAAHFEAPTPDEGFEVIRHTEVI